MQHDAIAPIIEDMRRCDMLVLATPTYYYSLPAQTKAVLDRMYARHGKPLTICCSVLFVTLEDSEDRTALLEAQYQKVADYMCWESLGVVCAGNLTSNRIPLKHQALLQVESLGRRIR